MSVWTLGAQSSLKKSETRITGTPALWDTPCRPMITHTSDSHQIPSQNKAKSKLQILKNCQRVIFDILRETSHVTHLLNLLDKMYKYEINPTRTVGVTEWTQDAGRTEGWTEGQTEGRTEWNQYTPQQLRCVRSMIIQYCTEYSNGT